MKRRRWRRRNTSGRPFFFSKKRYKYIIRFIYLSAQSKAA